MSENRSVAESPVRPEKATGANDSTEFEERVRVNQKRLTSVLQPQYDFIVCGAGSSGSVVARRLAETPEISVLLLEAGGPDDVPNITEADQWPTNIGSERDWGFQGMPNPRLNGRSIPFSMGKALGGGSAINVMVWARGHRSDWDFFATESGDPAWGYGSVLDIYRRIEDWHGSADPVYRGTGGPVFVQPAPNPNPLAPATVEAARSIGIPAFEHPNGAMMEGPGGASIVDVRLRNGKRESIFRSYTYPYMDQPNLTVLTHAYVTRVTLDGNRATGVEFSHRGTAHAIRANAEVVLSLGAMHTPKVLMYSGIGDSAELRKFGIQVRQHLPGVGRNFQDHVAIYSGWEYRKPLPPRNNLAEATAYWTTTSDSNTPDVLICESEVPLATEAVSAQYGLPQAGFSLVGGLAHPRSRGRLRLTGPDPHHPIQIDANTFDDPDDMKVAVACLELCRAIGNSGPLRSLVKREVFPGNLGGNDLDEFIRNAATSFWHETGTAKMGQDPMSVVDRALQVYGIENLRIADGSIMPRTTTGNTMAPCVIIGERASSIISAHYGL
jgi:choline dehydrogenase